MSTTTARYQLSRPTRASTIASLSRVFSDREAASLWSHAASGLVDPDAEDLSVADVRTVCDRLAERPGLVGVLGASLRVRCDTYLCLQRQD